MQIMIKHLTRKYSKSIVRLIGLFLITLFFLSVGSIQAIAQNGDRNSIPNNKPIDLFRPGEVLVKFNPSVAVSLKNNVMAQYHAIHDKDIYGMPVQVWKVPEGKELQVIEALNQNPLVVYAEPNYIYHAFVLPNDPGYPNQWGLTKVHAASAWGISTGSAGVTIAIIDTGIDETHPDLAGKIVAGYDFVDGDTNPHDLNGHGTHVAGIIGARRNETGVVGVAPLCRLLIGKVLGDDGSGSSRSVASGIDWAVDRGAEVISMSLGSSQPSQDIATARYINVPIICFFRFFHEK